MLTQQIQGLELRISRARAQVEVQVGGQRRKPLLQAGALRVAGCGPPGVPWATRVSAAHAPRIQCLAPPASRHQAIEYGERAYHVTFFPHGCLHARTRGESDWTQRCSICANV